VRILAVGDQFIPVDAFAAGFERLAPAHELRFLQLDESLPHEPATDSERAIREYAGSPDELAAAIGDAEVLAVHAAPVTAEVLAAAPALRLLGCARGGPVNIDLAAAAAAGLPVVSTPGKNAEAVAELALAFMVSLARVMPRAQRATAEGNLGESAIEGARFIGSELGGKSLGLVGFGHVGSRVAPRARAFGMRVLAFDPHRQIDADGVVQVDSLAELLAASDFVSLHARAGAENEDLIGAAEFAAMRPGAFFVNTARETLVDEAALDAALAAGLGGAALDVVRPQATAGPHPLLAHDNVMITPHVGGATAETLARGVEMLAEEVERLAAGEPPLRPVPAPEGAPR
jgi:D-3-phosphoglycerate dehydrogenase / 2-oxoglutarate reductase